MERFWKWLMRMDARGIFILALLLFLLVTGWWGWHFLFAPSRRPAGTLAAGDEMQDVSAPRPLGVIDYVERQFGPDALIVPVNPFRPTFEALFSQEARDFIARLRDRDGAGRDGRQPIRLWPPRRPAQPSTDDAGDVTAPPPPTPPPTLTYRGMLQRPDGRRVAYLHDSRRGGARFVAAGETLYDAEVVEVLAGGIVLRLADGSSRTLADGDALTLEAQP